MSTWVDICAPFVKRFESCRLVAYRDIVGVLTCGWGSTGPDIHESTIWTQEQADNRFLADLQRFCCAVDSMARVAINDHQKAALTSFAYNLGAHALAGSTLMRKLNNGDTEGASAEFVKWDRAGGVEIAGLLHRRQAEQALFNGDVHEQA